MPERSLRIGDREPADLDRCVEMLATVHETSGYPANWPADPIRWLTPTGTLQAWVAAGGEAPMAGHVLVRQLPAMNAAGRRSAEVGRLFVSAQNRRQGVARAPTGPHQLEAWSPSIITAIGLSASTG